MNRILSDFIDAWQAGNRPDATEYVDRAPPAERAELAHAIETFMALAPEPRYSDDAWAQLTADPAIAEIANAADAEPWSVLLPRERQRHGLTLDGLATALTDRLQLTGREAKTRAYLDDLEHDRLRPERLTQRLLDALATLLGVPKAALERARVAPTAPAGALYRRQGDATIEHDLEVIADAMLADADDWDEVDELFQGGR